MTTVDSPLHRLAEVAAAISEEWHGFDRDIEVFPAVVARHTVQLDLTPFNTLAKQQQLLFDSDVRELQTTSSFSDAYFKLYDDGHLWVEVLNWWGSDINIHDHNFSGVQFQLDGKSIDVKYKYSADVTVDGLEFGGIAPGAVRLWEPGSTSVVLPGDAEPHIVYHLDEPTVSLLIRTHPRPEYSTQHNYFPPGCRADYTVVDNGFRTNLKILRLLDRAQPDDFRECFIRTISRQDANENLLTFAKLMDILFRERNADLIPVFLDRGGPASWAILDAARRYHASNYISETLRKSPTVGTREAIALTVLASAPNAETLDELMIQVEDHLEGTDVRAATRKALAGLSKAHTAEVERVSRVLDVELI
ncbi:hypothetical protein ACIBEK_07025 [Nocardia fusca]|uniref:hypothetical protein n=1 Tax=Nocardia fusca TaxID=941183 RepID=UPI00379D8DD0